MLRVLREWRAQVSPLVSIVVLGQEGTELLSNKTTAGDNDIIMVSKTVTCAMIFVLDMPCAMVLLYAISHLNMGCVLCFQVCDGR